VIGVGVTGTGGEKGGTGKAFGEHPNPVPIKVKLLPLLRQKKSKTYRPSLRGRRGRKELKTEEDNGKHLFRGQQKAGACPH